MNQYGLDRRASNKTAYASDGTLGRQAPVIGYMSGEDFDVDSLASYLHLTPAQVEKMASRNQLPGRRVGGHWKFSRDEIHHWFEDRIGVSDQSELQQVEKVLETNQADLDEAISKLLQAGAIWIPLLARTKNSVIEQMCRLAGEAGLLWDTARMADAIRARETLHPTALENGVALLHPRRPLINILAAPFVALGITSTGIPFGGPRGILTDVFFLIASGDEKSHLKTLARLSRMIAVPEFLPQLRQAPDAVSAWEIIFATDEALDA